MLAMGLSPLAFSVARNALIAEGPSETILLPTLLRQSIDKDSLEYQVAPGAASVGSNKLPELLSESGRAVIVLDGDEAGEEMKQTLVDADAPVERIKTYRDIVDEPIVFEDLVDDGAYVEAFNAELQAWQESDEVLSPTELPDVGRAEAVDEWCSSRGLDPVNKPNVCQRLAEQATKGTQVVKSDKKDMIQQIHDWATDYFVIPTS